MSNTRSHDFKRSKIYPTIADLNREKGPDLSANLIGQSYQNSEHYFETQFNLLREESVRPLVDDVNKLRQILSEQKPKEKLLESIEKVIETNVYFDIRLIHPFVELDLDYGSVLKFTFDYKPIQSIDLVDCQHLMNGGILCLSSDNFQKSIIFGIIVKSQLRDRELKTNERIWNFCLKLDFDNNSAKHFNEFLLRPKTSYIGIESSSYYEGFRYSLNKLQNMVSSFPMNQYIVGIPEDYAIKAVPYLKEDSVYDMTCVELKKSEQTNDNLSSKEMPNPLSSVQVLNNDVFGDKRIYNKGVDELKKCSTFDTKQFDAFYAALTKELCIIEGPPGTGKTFVGLKIVECLLNNRLVWNTSSEIRPILIVCFKNHALDQFLEGIVKFNQNVVRIGGNSESKLLENYKLGTKENVFRERYELERTLRIHDEDNLFEHMTDERQLLDPKLKAMHRKNAKLRKRIWNIFESILESTQKISKSFQQILDFEEIEAFMKPKSWTFFFEREPKGLLNWLKADMNDTDFSNICQKQLNKKLRAEEFDEIYTLFKKNVLELKSDEKWTLYLYWRQIFFKKTKQSIKSNIESIEKEIEKLKTKRNQFRHMLCKGAEIIGLTVTGAAKYKDLVQAFNPKMMIVEEAAEVLEGHVVSALPSTIEHLILIGDHKQLRPLTNVQELTDKFKLDVSLFERLIENKLPFVQLELQHRMRPCISELLKVGDIYDNLRNGERVQNYPDIPFTFNKNLYFLDHQHIEDSNFCREVKDKSRSNLHEAKLVVELVKYFLLRNYPEEQITVLATYNAQISLIRKLMFDQKKVFVKEVEKPLNSKTVRNRGQTSCEENGAKDQEVAEELRVRVSSVDGFQGEENNIIIISFVRSSKRNSIGFLGNKNRVNVALSRAKHALFCIGNFSIMAKEEETKMWAHIIQHLSQKECFGEELNIGCKCTDEQSISMAGQLELLNLQIKNGLCTCMPTK